MNTCKICGRGYDEDFNVEHEEQCEVDMQEDAEVKKTNQRVKELMIEHGLDVSNELLVVQVSIIYLQAQRDLLVEQKEAK